MNFRGMIAGGLTRAANFLQPRRGEGMQSSSGWGGADFNRLYDDWDAWTTSPDFESRYAFRIMRARSRWFARNNPWMAGFVDELQNNVVGANGIQIRAEVKTLSGKKHDATNLAIEDGFLKWGMPEVCSADGHDSWVELQRQIVGNVAVDGECFVRRIFGFDNPFGYALQIIDPDLVDETYNVPAGPGQNRIRMGVEVDRWNRPVAYHIYTRYAEDMSGEPYRRERVDASEMLHLFVRWHRSNIPRGVTWFAPVIPSVRHIGEYEFNHLIASRAGAAQMAFILNKNPNAIEAYRPPKKNEKPRVYDMQAGAVVELLPGQEVANSNPNFPSGQYDPYTMSVLRGVARGLKTSYFSLTGDTRQANYSSQRAADVPLRDRYRGLQVWFAVHGVRFVYQDWVDMAALKQAIRLDSRLGSDYYRVAYHGRGWKWIDPFNDLKAAKMEIDLGLNSRTRLNAERGQDYEKIVVELSDEETFAESKGVDVSGNQMAGVSPTSVSPEGQDDDATDQNGGGKQDSSGTGSDSKPGEE